MEKQNDRSFIFEWDNGFLKESEVNEYKKAIKKIPARKLEEDTLILFNKFLRNL